MQDSYGINDRLNRLLHPMLNRKLIPTPLIESKDRAPIQVVHQPPAARFRVLYVFGHVLLLLVHAAALRVVGRLTHDRLGELLRDFCQRMGVLWIKLGQLLSMRADLAPPGVRAQLAKLLDRVQGFPTDMAIRMIEAELGGPLERWFTDFDRASLAAASIGQVHTARLRKEGAWVAVKVRRPDVTRVCARDLVFLEYLVGVLEWLNYKPQARWRDMFWEVQEAMTEELDYRFEASNIRRMRKNLRPHGIYVPRVFGRYSTSAVLVMEFVRGVLMSDYLRVAESDPDRLAEWRDDNNVRPATVARRLVHSLFRQTFEENLFHGDLHPGNIVLLRDSRIAFLDFGSLGSMERDQTRNVDLYLQALGARQYSKLVDIFFLFSPSLPPVNLSECKSEMIRRLQAWDLRCRVPDLPFNDKSFNSIQDEMVFYGSTYGISPVWTFFRMTRALTTMDASLRELIPQANFHRLVNSYFRRRVGRTRDRLAARMRDSGQNLRDWFELQDRMLDDMRFRGGIVRRAAQVFERTSSQVTLFFARIFRVAVHLHLLAGVALLPAFLQQIDPERVGRWLPEGAVEVLSRMPPLDGQVWALIFAALAFSGRTFAVLSRRFREQDVETGEG